MDCTNFGGFQLHSNTLVVDLLFSPKMCNFRPKMNIRQHFFLPFPRGGIDIRHFHAIFYNFYTCFSLSAIFPIFQFPIFQLKWKAK